LDPWSKVQSLLKKITDIIKLSVIHSLIRFVYCREMLDWMITLVLGTTGTKRRPKDGPRGPRSHSFQAIASVMACLATMKAGIHVMR
jgi:cytosine/uracil/thiamine/allantoin permease